jgi:hypothetical protein
MYVMPYLVLKWPPYVSFLAPPLDATLCFSRASVHPVPLPRYVAVEVLWHNYSNAMPRRYVGSSDAEDLASKSPLLASN